MQDGDVGVPGEQFLRGHAAFGGHLVEDGQELGPAGAAAAAPDDVDLGVVGEVEQRLGALVVFAGEPEVLLGALGVDTDVEAGVGEAVNAEGEFDLGDGGAGGDDADGCHSRVSGIGCRVSGVGSGWRLHTLPLRGQSVAPGLSNFLFFHLLLAGRFIHIFLTFIHKSFDYTVLFPFLIKHPHSFRKNGLVIPAERDNF